MKTLISVFCAIAVLVPAVPATETAGEKAEEAWDATKETAKDVGRTTKETAKDVGRTLKKGTKKAAHTVKEALTPDPDANRVEVKLSADRIDMPKSISSGKTAFVATNTGNEKLTFEIERHGEEQNFAMTLAPNQTKVFHVNLERGKYHAGILAKGRETHRHEVNFRVK
jgi:hypothetical protein